MADLTREHHPVLDKEICQYLDRIFGALTWDRVQKIQYQDYDSAWRKWLGASSYNSVRGLDRFRHSCFIAGATPVFGAFIARHRDRRIRVSKDDFKVTAVMAKNHGAECVWLEDQDLSSNDCMIMSVPFSANGTQHPEATRWLNRADQLSVPVMIDGAYFSISHDIQYPLERSCVQEVCFSLSKSHAGNVLRLGIRFSLDAIDDIVSAAQVGADLFDRMGALVTIELLQKYSHDWFIEKYRPLSDQVCQELDLVPTNTVSLALGGSRFQEFNRGGYNRVCISQRLSKLSHHG